MAKRRRKMTAKQAMYFGKRRRGSKRGRSPRVVVVSSNPRHHRKRRHHVRRRMRRNPRPLTIRRMRRNPIGGSFLTTAATYGAVATGGLIATQWLTNNLPIPGQFQQSNMSTFTQIAMALLVGWGVDAVGGGADLGAAAAAGGLLPVFSNLVSGMGMGGAQMGQGGNYGGGYPFGQGNQQMGRYLGARMGFLKGPRINRIRAMRQVMAPHARLRGMPMMQPTRPNMMLGAPHRFFAQANGITPLNVATGLGATTPYAYTRRRIHRNGGGLGWIGPAKTLGRYLQGR